MLTVDRMNPLSIGFWEGILRTLTEAGTFRLVVQPLMAVVLGIRLGITDAKEGRGPFLFRLFTTRHHHLDLLQESLRDAALPLSVALIVDGVLQKITLGTVRPLGAVVVGAMLVWLPFTIARALTNRVWHVRKRRARFIGRVRYPGAGGARGSAGGSRTPPDRR